MIAFVKFSLSVCVLVLLSCWSATSFLLPYNNVRKVCSQPLNLISSSSSKSNFAKSNIAKSSSPVFLNSIKSSHRLATSKAMLSSSLLDENLLPSSSVFDFLPSPKQFLFFSVLFASAFFHQQVLQTAGKISKKIPRLLRTVQSHRRKHSIVSVDQFDSSSLSEKTTSTDEETKKKKNTQLANPWKVCRFERKEILNHEYVLYKFRIIPSLPSSEDERISGASLQKNIPDLSHLLSSEVGKKVSIFLCGYFLYFLFVYFSFLVFSYRFLFLDYSLYERF
jgi:hypothetical protein